MLFFMSYRKYFIYGLIDPSDKSIFYIGRSVNLAVRLAQHRTTGASKVIQKMKQIESGGSLTEIKVLETAYGKKKAHAVEKRLIFETPNILNTTFYPDERLNHHIGFTLRRTDKMNLMAAANKAGMSIHAFSRSAALEKADAVLGLGSYAK